MNNFLSDADKQLYLCGDRSAVMSELQDHLETKKEFFQDIGYDESASRQKADEAMGDGEVIGQRLNALHAPNKTKDALIITAISAVNILIPIILGIPSGENTFLRPFLASVLTLVLNMLFTALAIKLKSVKYSVLLLIYSLVMMHISASKLAYPFCNLMLAENNSEHLQIRYYALRAAIDVFIILLMAAPNLYNIYYCIKIKRMKNTKKQNNSAKSIMVFCLIFSVLCAVLSFPCYILSQSITDEQKAIHTEFVEWISETEKTFDCDQTQELKSYIENCRYEFEKGGPGEYNYCRGNWLINVYINETGYSASVSTLVLNSSQDYLFADWNKEDELISYLGDDEVSGTTGAAPGSTKAEIHRKMSEINYSGFSYTCNAEESTYTYDWYMDSYLYGIFGYSSYEFYFNDNICTGYDLVLD